MDRKTGIITRLKNNPANPDQLSRPPVLKVEDYITSITEDIQNTIWIGTLGNGIVRFDPASGSKTHFGNSNDKEQRLKDISTWCIYPSRDGLLWLSTRSANLFTIDISNNVIPHQKIDGVTSFLDVVEENTNTVLLGTQVGLVRQDLSTGNIKRYQIDPNRLLRTSYKRFIRIKGDLFGSVRSTDCICSTL